MVDKDVPDEELNDSALLGEIELLAELMEAVTRAGHQLCDSEIDHALLGHGPEGCAEPAP